MKNLKLARKLLGFTQKSLGEALGVSSQMVKNWELGIKNPRLENLISIADILTKEAREIIEKEWLEVPREKISIDYLLGRSMDEGTSVLLTRIWGLSTYYSYRNFGTAIYYLPDSPSNNNEEVLNQVLKTGLIDSPDELVQYSRTPHFYYDPYSIGDYSYGGSTLVEITDLFWENE
ncbi:helix-turn-helix domain-containing protein [Bacillus wiedmannii]|uniref:helix-turn-helix domain-containing protein n=1 Tax=Bacillus wiedmannii TaxID=1890302 RepID=UPI000A4FCC87|nr:helix-turn-helix transcriptional regulator [Bacillus wiedmannii]